jgi:hypothetical protein
MALLVFFCSVLFCVLHVSLFNSEVMMARRPHYTFKVDVYSFGVILGELITWAVSYSTGVPALPDHGSDSELYGESQDPSEVLPGPRGEGGGHGGGGMGQLLQLRGAVMAGLRPQELLTSTYRSEPRYPDLGECAGRASMLHRKRESCVGSLRLGPARPPGPLHMLRCFACRDRPRFPA